MNGEIVSFCFTVVVAFRGVTGSWRLGWGGGQRQPSGILPLNQNLCNVIVFRGFAPACLPWHISSSISDYSWQPMGSLSYFHHWALKLDLTLDHTWLCGSSGSYFEIELGYYGLSGTALQFFKSFLCNRRQVVSIDGELSNEVRVECGMPQGSILGPSCS